MATFAEESATDPYGICHLVLDADKHGQGKDDLAQ